MHHLEPCDPEVYAVHYGLSLEVDRLTGPPQLRAYRCRLRRAGRALEFQLTRFAVEPAPTVADVVQYFADLAQILAGVEVAGDDDATFARWCVAMGYTSDDAEALRQARDELHQTYIEVHAMRVLLGDPEAERGLLQLTC